jgi:vitamin B12 transporter
MTVLSHGNRGSMPSALIARAPHAFHTHITFPYPYGFTRCLKRVQKRTVSVFLLMLMIFGLSTPIFSQDRSKSGDTLRYTSPEITVQATRIEAPWAKQPVSLVAIDSIAQQTTVTNVADLLTMSAPLFLKDYGPGGIATLSQRGLGANQTQVLWEGLELNHPMLGVVDLSLLPTGVVSEIEVGASNPSAAYGSGSLGGTVYMHSKSAVQGAQLTQSWSGLGNWSTSVQTGFESEDHTWKGLLAGSYVTNDNDYEYRDPIAQTNAHRTHNSVDRQYLLGKISRTGDQVDWTAIGWWNRADQQIPGSVVSSSNQATQYDEFIRGLIRAEWYASGFRWKAEIGGSRVRLNYDQLNAGINSRSLAYQGKATLDLRRYDSDRWQWKTGVSIDQLRISTNNYPQDKVRSVGAWYVNAQWQPFKRVHFYPALRVDHYSDFEWAISPSLGINGEIIGDRLFAYANGSRSFNAPTFNDLYWEPGGDPTLIPEHSYQVEAGMRWLDTKWGRHQLSGYRLWIEDGIQWLPGPGSVFRAENVKALRGYGLEWSSRMSMTIERVHLVLNHNATWTRTEIAEPRFGGDQAVGKQLPYVPEFNIKEQLSANYRELTLSLAGRWVSTRYTTEDHLRALDPYYVWDAGIAYNGSLKKLNSDWSDWAIQTALTIKNLGNTSYQVVEYYPMPGRYLKLSIQLKFKS